MSLASPAKTPGVFAPRPEGRFSWVLLGFIGLSLAAHGFTFLLFQVVYPQRVTIPPPSVQVGVLTSGIPEHDALLRWIAAEDPALAAGSPVAVPPALFETPFRPSFQTLRTPPRTLPPTGFTEEPGPSPLPIPLGTVLPRDTPAAPAEQSPTPLPPTLVTMQGDAGAAHFHGGSVLQYRQGNTLETAEYLLGLGDDGAVRYVFLQRSSGNNDADRAGEAYLATGQVQPAESAAGGTGRWVRATIHWGRETYQP